MSELIDNSKSRKKLLKHMILQLHEGVAPEQIKTQIANLMSKIPYGEIVEVEQELISEGLPEEEVLRLCDIHSKALEGNIDLSQAKKSPAGHPVDTFEKENAELIHVCNNLKNIFTKVSELKDSNEIKSYLNELQANFNSLMDVDKHYQRKENLLFPFIEKKGITGPPKVMWGKHDQIRGLIKAAIEACSITEDVGAEEISSAIDILLKPAVEGVEDMIMKEEAILFPMCMDTLNDIEWYDIYKQTPEIGFCLFDPSDEWQPEGIEIEQAIKSDDNLIQLPSGSFTPRELNALLNTLPFDLTFVDANDKVKYFSQGEERIFARNRAILKRDVRMCHPPSSVHIVDKIIDDFKSGKESRAPFWINMGGKFIHIEYFAMRDEKGEYLGTLEVSQNATNIRDLEGEQRLLSYK